jgi:hypothetical protein
MFQIVVERRSTFTPGDKNSKGVIMRIALSIQKTVESLMPNIEEILDADAKGLLIPDYSEPLIAVAFDLRPYKVAVGHIEAAQFDMLAGKPPYWQQAADRSRAALNQLVRPHGLQVRFHSEKLFAVDLGDQGTEIISYWNAVLFTTLMPAGRVRRIMPGWQEPKADAQR